MINRKSLRALAATVLVFMSIPASATILVPGRNGDLPLSQIPDLIQHVTGMGGGTFRLGKQSLMIVSEQRNGSSISVNPRLLTFFNDFSVGMVTNFSVPDPSTTTMDKASWLAVPGLHPAVLSTTFVGKGDIAGGKRVTRVESPASGTTYNVLSEKTETTSNEYKFNISFPKDTAMSNRPVIARAAGITVNGFNGELVAEATSSGNTLSLAFTSVTKDNSGNPVTARVNSLAWSGTFTASKIGGKDYLPASIAVGDLNDDGYANEVALITEDVNGVYLSIFRISYAKGAFSKTAYVNNTKLHTHTKRMELRRGNRHGLWGAPSVAAVAADFDNDGKGDELVALYLEAIDYTSRAEERAPDSILGYPVGVTYDWDGEKLSSKTTTMDPRNEYVISDALAGCSDVKAVAADLNGDGQKSLVLMLAQCNLSDCLVSTVINAWSWRNGQFKLEEGKDYLMYDSYSGLDLGIDANDRPISRFSDRPVFARDFAIVAGPFTGRIGDAVTCDDLVILHLTNKESDKLNNASRHEVMMLYNLHNANSTGSEPEYEFDAKTLLYDGLKDIWNDETKLYGLAAADYASEGVMLADAQKIVDSENRSYLAILQAPPYHVDTLTADGSARQAAPTNFNYRPGSKVEYSHESSTSESKSVEFKTSSSVETLFSASNPKEIEQTISGLRGALSLVDGISSMVGQGFDIAGEITDMIGVGGDTLKKATELNAKVGKTTGTLGGILTKLTDSVTKTTSGTNTNASATDITMATAASNEDVLHFTDAKRYIWRYKILTKPAPTWLKGQPKGGERYSGTAADDYENFITFTICDPLSNPKTIFGMADSRYQPFHEPGNLFSYPGALEQLPGYANRRPLTEADSWGGPEYSKTMKFTKSTGENKTTTEEVKVGFITSAISMLSRLLDSPTKVNIPEAADPETFTRNVSTTEALNVTLPYVDLGARFNAEFEGYLDTSGATTMAFAVTDFDMYDAVWSSNSLYRKQPDPSLVLPYKFVYRSGSQTFEGNKDDNKAYQMKGIRFSCVEDSSNPIASSNLLVKGLKYRIEVPVYNASFVNAGKVTVRLSYSTSNKYNAKKTKIADTTVTLYGHSNGVSRAWATFEWTPGLKVASGNYYLFAEIDPSNAITNEIHESRKNSKGAITDYGGNNLGYFPFSLASVTDKAYAGKKQTNKQATAKTSSMTAKFSAAAVESYAGNKQMTAKVSSAADEEEEDGYPDNFPLVEPTMFIAMPFEDDAISIRVTLNGEETFKGFYDRYLASADEGESIPVTAEFTCEGISVDVIPNVTLDGYSMNFSDILEEIANMLERQMNGEELSEEELAEARERSANLIACEDVTLFPGQNHEVYLTLNEKDIANIRSSYLDLGLAGMIFVINVPEEAVASTPDVDSESEPGSESQPGSESKPSSESKPNSESDPSGESEPGSESEPGGESEPLGVGSSSGGCDTGVFGVLGAAALLMLTLKRRN